MTYPAFQLLYITLTIDKMVGVALVTQLVVNAYQRRQR